jgi:hypothetical protein
VRRAKRAAALPCGRCEKDKYIEGSTKRLDSVITMNNKATRIAEAEAKPEAARPERATADEMVNDIICRFENLFEQKETEGIILLWQARGTPKK